MKITLDLAESYARLLVADMRETGTHEVLPNLVNVADQIAAQLPKPKPEEPKGLGAVVVDRRGDKYVRVAQNPLGGGRDWKSEHLMSSRYLWNELDAAEVLSEGVEA